MTILVNALNSTLSDMDLLKQNMDSGNTIERNSHKWIKCDTNNSDSSFNSRVCGTLAIRQRHRRRPGGSRRDTANNVDHTMYPNTETKIHNLDSVQNNARTPTTTPNVFTLLSNKSLLKQNDSADTGTYTQAPYTDANGFVITTEKSPFDVYSLCSELLLVERRQYLLPADVVSTVDGIQGCVIQDVPILPIWVMALTVYVLCLLLLGIILWLYR